MASPEYIKALLEGEHPSESPPTEAPWEELGRLLLNVNESDRPAVFQRWVAQAGTNATEVFSALVQMQGRDSNCEQNCAPPHTRIWSLDQFITEDFGRLPVLVGEENNALIVAGEGMFIIGTRGAGKTNLCMDFALRMSAGLDVIGFQTASPLNLLILQAELPAPFFQHRFNRMVRGYECANGSDFRECLSRVHIVNLDQPLNLCIQDNRQLLSAWVKLSEAQIVIIDPFLSFFRGEENSNPEVREFLDSIKFEVALPNRCGVIFTDHVAKVEVGKEPSARGAGAKGDWASSIINISTKRDPSNPDVRLVSVEISKLRYGLEPSGPILLRRDPQSLLHSPQESERDPRLDQIRQLIIDQDGIIRSQTAFIQLIRDRLEVGARVARRLLDNAVADGFFETQSGRSNSRVYRLPHSTADTSDSTHMDGDDD